MKIPYDNILEMDVTATFEPGEESKLPIEKVALVSIARSLRRIADVMEYEANKKPNAAIVDMDGR